MLSTNAYLMLMVSLDEAKEKLNMCFYEGSNQWQIDWNNDLNEAISEIRHIQGVLYDLHEVQKQTKVD